MVDRVVLRTIGTVTAVQSVRVESSFRILLARLLKGDA